MGEVQSVSFTSEPTGPDAPEPEATQAPSETVVPDKFRDGETGEVNVDALLASYNQLEQKLGSGEEEEAESEAEPTEEASESEEETEQPPAPSQEVLTKYSEEFFENGELSDDSFDTLETLGYPRNLVEAFIEGQKALVSGEQERMYAEVGGPEAYAKMTEWASNNMTEEAKTAYNNAAQSGDMEQALLAVRGLRDSYIRSEGQQPSLLQGRSSAGPASSPFRSTAELVKAMKDPRYKEDSAYRADVEARLRSSQTVGG